MTWEWISEIVIPQLDNRFAYNGQLNSPDERNYLQNYYFLQLGSTLIRQFRVKPGNHY